MTPLDPRIITRQQALAEYFDERAVRARNHTNNDVACRQAAWMEQNARDIRDALKHIAAVDAERAAAAADQHAVAPLLPPTNTPLMHFSNAKSSARCSRRRMPRLRRWSDVP
jgi:hypothetical protein